MPRPEVRRRLGDISDSTFYRLVRSGELPARKIGSLWRVPESELLKFTQEVPRSTVEVEDGESRI